MIISHKNKFIFIKPQKTAGTSVELMLSRICGEDDIITPLGFDPDPNVRKKHKAKPAQNYFRKKPLKYWQMNELYHFVTKGRKPNLNYWEHLNAHKIKDYVGDEIWNTYMKISIVRNPWDHAVSWFKWQEKFGYEDTKKGEFEKYLVNNYRSTWPFYTANYGLYDMDYMIRFEDISQSVKNLSSFLKIEENLSLPMTKTDVRKKKTYSEFYTSNYLVDIVSEKANSIISKFNYKF
jgi:hypothetical protein